MPLARYEIRNEYELADPELYRAADKDDPEALLEGVSMAGLVGVLRQLGDLAEFAAEVFHDLHEEVMVTAARGHGLMARVQQLEAEVPSIEKAFLSQTDQSQFFSNAGADWHPNLHMEQNLITRGDLPRFVMDSYEECRGPPRLFLLDKFDVAGAGACLKRYTDPSLFKVETASSGMEFQREKKSRKVKKGSRWKNGETPEVMPPSHAKLHQLFLEERVENGHSDPARLVKLKRRQLNGSPFDLKSGRSCMEKLLGTPSPEHKAVYEVSVNQSPLKLTLDNCSELGLDLLEIGTISPARNSSQGRESTASSPIAQEVVLKSFTNELDEEVFTRDVVKVPDPIFNGEDDTSLHITHKMAIDELAVDGDRKTESVDGDQSDDLMSEVDNYMDALTTIESELETDNDYKPKNNLGFWKVGKKGRGSDAKDEYVDLRAIFSDSQSFGNSSVSDDGKSSFKKGRSSFSYSDSLSNVAENAASDSEEAVKVSPSENCAAETLDSPLDHPSENVGTLSSEAIVHNSTYNEEDAVRETVEATRSSCPSDLNSSPPSISVADSIMAPSEETVIDKPSYERINLAPETLNDDQNGKDLQDSSIILPIEEVDHGDRSNLSYMEKEGDEDFVNAMLETDNGDGFLDKNLVEGNLNSPKSFISLSKEQFQFPVSSEVIADTVVTEMSESITLVNPVEVDTEVNDAGLAAGVDSEMLTGVVEPPKVDSFKAQQYSDMAVNISEDEPELTKVDIKVAAIGGVTVPSENQSNHTDVNLDEDVVVSPVSVATCSNEGVSDANCLASDFVGSLSGNGVDIQECFSANQDPHQKRLHYDELVLPEFCTELEEQKEVKELEVAFTDLESGPQQSVSDSQSNVDVLEHVQESALPDETQDRNTSYVTNITILPSSEFNNQKTECYLRHSVDCSEDAASSPTCYLPEAETALAHSVELQDGQNLAESSFAAREEVNSESSVPQNLYICDHAEPGMLSEQSLELQSNKHDAGCSHANERISKLSDRMSENIEGLDASPNLAALPSQELLVQSAGQETNNTVLSETPFKSVFPSFGPVRQSLEEVPPLPPLPPMQWRLGKFPPAPQASQEEWTDWGHGTPFPTQSFITYEHFQAEAVSSGGESMQPSNPFLYVNSGDIQRSEHLSAESMESSLQPISQSPEMPTVARDAKYTHDSRPLEGVQSLNPFLNSSDINHLGSDDDLMASRENPIGSSSETLSSAATQKHAETDRDPEPLDGRQIKNLNQVIPESISEAKIPENSSQNVREENNYVDKSASPSTRLEHQPQQDLVTLHGETTWSQSTLAFPPNYAVGKPNGSKIPRPRNPLIDAVVAHDKSKLKKVTERICPQVAPNIDERDSLLEQIRAKSFSLKPATVTRPSMQGIHGPKTNLKVAAILEKANQIRQAFAGSDEDDDSDSWSDS
ncbi:protein SCAR2-like isoform X2 [Mercurialis annua]|uniref:protein SCAR2-like isoform X2 n=1 Tax=Mercurialis annua TaxID=3986 RepID=UPI00216061CF|nr:protein SCAR2-like isoform X2 [Mercurialis annua]